MTDDLSDLPHRFVSDDESSDIPDMDTFDDGETISFLALDLPHRPLGEQSQHQQQQSGGKRRGVVNSVNYDTDDDDVGEVDAAHTTEFNSGQVLGSFELLPNVADRERMYPAAAVRHIVFVTIGMAMANAALNAVFALYVNEFFGIDEDRSTAWTGAWNIVIWSAAPVAGIFADRNSGTFSVLRWAFVFWFLSAVASLVTTIPEVAKYFDTSSPLAMSPNTVPLLTFAIVGATGQAIGFGIVNTLLPMFMGDQFVGQASDRSKAFVILYFSYNVGTLIGETVAPVLRQEQTFPVCFVFVVAAVWLGLVAYVSGSEVVRKVTRFAAPSEGLLSSLKRDFLSVTKIGWLYLLLTMFWAQYVQLNSTFVFQARDMDLSVLGYTIPPDAVPATEDIGVLLAIVFVDRVVDPLLARWRIRATPLRKIGAGLVFSTLSFVAATLLQWQIERAAQRGVRLSVWLQLPQILLMSLAETLTVISGLQFGYAASPGHARPIVFALWSLSTALGATVVVSSAPLLRTTSVLWFASYAGAMALSAIAFILVARRFR
jgi:dipeptide/tripeptide permease